MDNYFEDNSLQKDDKISDIYDINQNGFSLIKSMKSVYILKKLFSFLENKIILRIVAHNKQIQKKLELNINDYKKASGRYIKGDR